MPKKEESHKNFNVLGDSGLSAKSVTGVAVWFAGSVAVVEINYTGGPTFIKIKGGQADIGGDANWGTGKLVS